MNPALVRLVIDTNVPIHAGSRESEENLSKYCRDILRFILEPENVFRVVMSFELANEWVDRTDPRKRSCIKWLAELESRGKVVSLEIDDYIIHQFRILVAAYDTKNQITNHARKCEKDAHLLEAAAATDGIVISPEARMKNHFHTMAAYIDFLKEIIWLNPNIDDVIDWLKNGAPSDNHRKLGYKPTV